MLYGEGQHRGKVSTDLTVNNAFMIISEVSNAYPFCEEELCMKMKGFFWVATLKTM